MKILFCRSKDLVSWLIRMFTWSSWSHVAILTPEGTAIEATWPKVREVPVKTITDAHDEWRIVELPCADPDVAIRWARAQIGLRYDWTALAGFLVHHDWSEPFRWFCSELAAAAFEESGSPLFRGEVMRRITPEHLWMLPGA